MASQRVKEIDLTAEDVLAASLRELGVDPCALDDDLIEKRVFDKYVELAKQRGTIPLQREVGEALSLQQAAVSHAVARLLAAGKMQRIRPPGKRPVYVPLVAKSG